MAEIEIEYCVPCGFLDRALDVERAVLSNFGLSVDRASLVTGEHGVFRVGVVRTGDRDGEGEDGGRPRDVEYVWDGADDEYDVDEIVRRVRAAI